MYLPMSALSEASGVREKLIAQYSVSSGCHVRGKAEWDPKCFERNALSSIVRVGEVLKPAPSSTCMLTRM